ncbi:MAG: tetratricopeptide repeat protein [Planctomycetales bacterium]
MNPSPASDTESADAKKVDQAVESLANGDLQAAESLLQQVIANTPPNYQNQIDSEEGLSIKFWDQMAFVHYVTWNPDQKPGRDISWIPNAYPRAFYYLGFIAVKHKQFDQAIKYLDRGLAMDPSNPNFLFEKAQALVHSGKPEEALAFYGQVNEIGPFVNRRHLAVALRGRGFILIELQRLDEAEQAFKSSLELDPDNRIALHELAYIEHLRGGGSSAPAQTVASNASTIFRTCAACQKEVSKGRVFSVKGLPVFLCTACESRLTKKWWQFWK